MTTCQLLNHNGSTKNLARANFKFLENLKAINDDLQSRTLTHSNITNKLIADLRATYKELRSNIQTLYMTVQSANLKIENLRKKLLKDENGTTELENNKIIFQIWDELHHLTVIQQQPIQGQQDLSRQQQQTRQKIDELRQMVFQLATSSNSTNIVRGEQEQPDRQDTSKAETSLPRNSKLATTSCHTTSPNDDVKKSTFVKSKFYQGLQTINNDLHCQVQEYLNSTTELTADMKITQGALKHNLRSLKMTVLAINVRILNLQKELHKRKNN